MAPEQVDPARFKRTNTDPTKKMDIHSFAMTAYEVCSFRITVIAVDTIPLSLGPHGEQAICRHR